MDRKGVISLVLRIGLSAGLLVVLFWQIPEFETSELLPEFGDSTPYWLGAALILTIGSVCLAAVRWWEVATHIIDIDNVRFGRFLSNYFAGQFLSNFVPTTVGGDVLRVRRLSKDSGDSPSSFTSVVFERLSGWLVLPAISLAGFALNPGLRSLGTATTAAFVIALVTLGGLVLLILVAGNVWIGRRLERRATSGWVEWIHAIHLGLDSFRAHPKQIWRVLAASFMYQGVLMCAAWCAIQALGIEQVGPTALMAFFPAVLIMQVLPLGIGGLGVREGAFVLFFGPLGVMDERSIALGFLLYLLTLVSSVLGFPSLIWGGRRHREVLGAAIDVTPATPSR